MLLLQRSSGPVLLLQRYSPYPMWAGNTLPWPTFKCNYLLSNKYNKIQRSSCPWSYYRGFQVYVCTTEVFTSMLLLQGSSCPCSNRGFQILLLQGFSCRCFSSYILYSEGENVFCASPFQGTCHANYCVLTYHSSSSPNSHFPFSLG
jgi:hypothetical protein